MSISISKDQYSHALKEYSITEDCLYVVFSMFQDNGKADLLKSFALSYAGEEGAKSILSANQKTSMGCASLSQLKTIQEIMAQGVVHHAESDRLGGLWKAKTFFIFLASHENGVVLNQGLRVKAFTALRALDWAQQQYPHSQVAVNGTEEDFVELMNDMQRIFDEQDFSKIRCDYRKTFSGVDSYYLLSSKKRPSQQETHYFSLTELST